MADEVAGITAADEVQQGYRGVSKSDTSVLKHAGLRHSAGKAAFVLRQAESKQFQKQRWDVVGLRMD